MDKFKKALHIRLVCAGIYCAAVIALILLGVFHPGDAHVNDYIAGFSMGLFVGIEFVVIYFISKYTSALRNEDKLRKLFIKETDERLKLIRSKAGSSGIIIAIGGLMLGALAAGYYSETVFITLICSAVFVTVVTVIMKAYYWVKFSK